MLQKTVTISASQAGDPLQSALHAPGWPKRLRHLTRKPNFLRRHQGLLELMTIANRQREVQPSAPRLAPRTFACRASGLRKVDDADDGIDQQGWLDVGIAQAGE